MFLAQLPDPKSYISMGWVIAVLLSLGAGYLLILNIQLRRRQLNTPTYPGGQQPQPFVVKEAEVYVKTPDFNKKIVELKEEMSEIEKRLDAKFEVNQDIFRERFHKLDEELNAISINARNLGEKATEEFKKIEGRLGEMKSSLQHITVQNTTTNQQLNRTIENLPETIAKAIDRSRVTRR